VLDSINDFEKIAGLEELLHCLELIPYINEEKLLEYLERYDKQFLYQKAGYVLNHFRYDINNMITYGLFDESESAMLRKCVLFYFTVASDEVPDSFDVNRIYSLTNYRIRTDLQPVLRKKDRFDLLTAQKCVEQYLNELLILEKNERQYLDSFRANEYKPELLFEDVNILERIQNHPMALWKTNKF